MPKLLEPESVVLCPDHTQFPPQHEPDEASCVKLLAEVNPLAPSSMANPIVAPLLGTTSPDTDTVALAVTVFWAAVENATPVPVML
jgi:hypothetical protein